MLCHTITSFIPLIILKLLLQRASSYYFMGPPWPYVLLSLQSMPWYNWNIVASGII